MIKKGEPWGREFSGDADLAGSGDDAALAALIKGTQGLRVQFRPSDESDFARAVGIAVVDDASAVDVTTELVCDALAIGVDDAHATGVNMVVVGAAPDRQSWHTADSRLRVSVDGRVVHEGPATGVVIANGQYLRGNDVVPRGHPGDGRIEVHVYALRRNERRAMRSRLPTGQHLPHPRITVTTGRGVLVESTAGSLPVEIDRTSAGRGTRIGVEVTPGAFSLLV